jgi:hypothetical protein
VAADIGVGVDVVPHALAAEAASAAASNRREIVDAAHRMARR